MPAKTVSPKEIRRILAGEGHEPLTEMAVSKFVADGMPKAARGMYDAEACTHWYLGRLRTSVKRKESESASGEILSLDKEQTRLIKAKADNEEMTAAERRGTLLPLEFHEMEMGKLVQLVKMKFMNLPSRLSQKMEGLSSPEIKALLMASVKTTLGELSRSKNVDTEPKPESKPAAVPRKRARSRVARKPRTSKR